MSLFKKAGEYLAEPKSTIYARDADQKAAQRDELTAHLAEWQKQIDDLALPAESEDPDAMAKIAELEDNIAEARRLIRQKEMAERRLREMAEQELNQEQRAKDRARRVAVEKKARGRAAIAKRLANHAQLLAQDIAELEALNRTVHTSWSDAWPFVGPALTYPATLRALIEHELYEAFRAAGVKPPVARYSQSDWSGIHDKFKGAHSWLKAALSDEGLPVNQVLTEQVASPPLDEPAPVVEPEPEPMVLTGRGYAELMRHAQASERVAQMRDIDPFTGQEI